MASFVSHAFFLLLHQSDLQFNSCVIYCMLPLLVKPVQKPRSKDHRVDLRQIQPFCHFKINQKCIRHGKTEQETSLFQRLVCKNRPLGATRQLTLPFTPPPPSSFSITVFAKNHTPAATKSQSISGTLTSMRRDVPINCGYILSSATMFCPQNSSQGKQSLIFI